MEDAVGTEVLKREDVADQRNDDDQQGEPADGALGRGDLVVLLGHPPMIRTAAWCGSVG